MDPAVYREMAAVERDHWWFRGRRRIVGALIARVCRPPPAARILDAGCGTGGNLPALQPFGRVMGLEPDAGAAATALGRGYAGVVQAGLGEPTPFESAAFDLVVLTDVLEHIDDDGAALRAIVRILKPGGALVMTVPAFAFLWSAFDDEHHHRRRYRLRAVVERLRAAGLRVERASYYNAWLFPAIAAVRLLRRLLRRDRGAAHADLRVPARPLNAALEALFASERHLAGRLPLPVGVSIYACARRPAP